MDATAAHDIIEKLALGTDPSSGTPLDDSILQNPLIIRALFMAKDALATASQASAPSAQGTARPHAKSANAGKRWDTADKDCLRELHLGGASSREIARQLGRSNGAIISQLIKDGLIEDTDGRLAALSRRNRGGREEEGRQATG